MTRNTPKVPPLVAAQAEAQRLREALVAAREASEANAVRRSEVEVQASEAAVALKAASAALAQAGDDAAATAFREAKHRHDELRGQLEGFDDYVIPEAAANEARASAALEEADRLCVYLHAEQLAAAAAARLEVEYPALGRQFLSLLSDLLIAQSAVRAANETLPEGRFPIADPEASVRDRPSVTAAPGRDLGIENQWVYAGTTRLVPEDRISEISSRSDGTGMLPGRGMLPTSERVERRPFRRMQTRSARPWERGARLSETELPALKAGLAWWRPTPHASLEDVASAAMAIDAPSDAPEIATELVPA